MLEVNSENFALLLTVGIAIINKSELLLMPQSIVVKWVACGGRHPCKVREAIEDVKI